MFWGRSLFLWICLVNLWHKNAIICPWSLAHLYTSDFSNRTRLYLPQLLPAILQRCLITLMTISLTGSARSYIIYIFRDTCAIYEMPKACQQHKQNILWSIYCRWSAYRWEYFLNNSSKQVRISHTNKNTDFKDDESVSRQSSCVVHPAEIRLWWETSE